MFDSEKSLLASGTYTGPEADEARKEYREYMSSVTPEKRLELIKTDGNCFQFITNPTAEERWIGLKDDGHNIQYIIDPTPVERLYAIEGNPCSHGDPIIHVKNPTPEERLVAIFVAYNGIDLIDNPTEEEIAFGKVVNEMRGNWQQYP